MRSARPSPLTHWLPQEERRSDGITAQGAAGAGQDVQAPPYGPACCDGLTGAGWHARHAGSTQAGHMQATVCMQDDAGMERAGAPAAEF